MTVQCAVLFDGEDIHEHARVIIDGDRITAVEGSDQAARPEVETEVRCHFAMPGLIDSHAHAFGYKESPPGVAPFGPHQDAMRLLLYAGVTTVREMGNSIEALRFLQHWTTESHGPRLYSVGPFLDDLPLAGPAARLVQTDSDVSREVENLAQEGVWAIKAHCHVGPHLLAATVSAARRLDRGVAVHLGASRASDAARAGVRNIEHLVDLLEPSWFPGGAALATLTSAEKASLWSQVDLRGAPVNALVDTLAAQGIVICPALIATRHAIFLDEVVNDPYLDYMLLVMPYHRYLKGMRNPLGYAIGKRYLIRYLPFPHLSKTARRDVECGLERLQGLLVLLHERGVTVVVGTDTPCPGVTPGFSLAQEMRLWVDSGISPLDVLRAATGRAADSMGLSDVGRIRPGAAADLLLLDADPREEIAALERQTKQVICRGRLVDRARLKTELVAKIEKVAS